MGQRMKDYILVLIVIALWLLTAHLEYQWANL